MATEIMVYLLNTQKYSGKHLWAKMHLAKSGVNLAKIKPVILSFPNKLESVVHWPGPEVHRISCKLTS